MSRHQDTDPFQGFQFSPELPPSSFEVAREMPYCPPLTPLAQQLESITVATRALEASVEKERAYARQLKEHLARINNRMLELQKIEADLRNQVSDLLKNENASALNIKNLSAEIAHCREELNRYRKVWAEVLGREQQARAVLTENVENMRRFEEVKIRYQELTERLASEKARREHVERQAKGLQGEVHQLLGRVQFAEAKASQLSSELQVSQESKELYKVERARLEQSFREEFDAQIPIERKKIESEYQAKWDKALIELRASQTEERVRLTQQHSDQLKEKEKKILDLTALSEERKIESSDHLRQFQALKNDFVELRKRETRVQEALAAAEKRSAALAEECRLMQEILFNEVGGRREVYVSSAPPSKFQGSC